MGVQKPEQEPVASERSDIQHDAFTVKAKGERSKAGGSADEGGADDTHSTKSRADAGRAQDDDSDDGDGGGRDYKKSSQYGSHMKSSVAASEFSRSKSIAEQRAYLPIYGVREQLLKVIRDNSVSVSLWALGRL